MTDYCYITKCRQPGKEGVYIEGSFNPDFVELIKAHVPAEHRAWDGDLKRWWVSEQYAGQAERDAKGCYSEVMEV